MVRFLIRRDEPTAELGGWAYMNLNLVAILMVF